MKELERPTTKGFQTQESLAIHITNLDEYINQLESERDELKEAEELAYMVKGLAQKGYRNLQRELQTLKEEINKLPDYVDDKYDLNNKGDLGYINDCIEYKKTLKTLIE